MVIVEREPLWRKSKMLLNNNQLQNLDITANLSQLVSLFLLLRDASNNDVIDQNESYLKRIVEQNEEIIKLLKEMKK